jgi:hypothetical protein
MTPIKRDRIFWHDNGACNVSTNSIQAWSEAACSPVRSRKMCQSKTKAQPGSEQVSFGTAGRKRIAQRFNAGIVAQIT